MLFHVTITHSQEECPGRRPEQTPELIGPAERLEALGNELSVTSHSLVWGASCILWAEPEHVAYALLEAPSLESVERYIGALTPAGWATRALPVFTLPGRLEAVRQLLTMPALPFVQSLGVVAEPPDDVDTADTLKGLTVGSSEQRAADEPSVLVGEPSLAVEEPPPLAAAPPTAEPPDKQVTRTIPPPLAEPADQQVTRAIPQPVFDPPVVERPVAPEPVAPPGRASSAVTRFIERPAILEGLANPAPPPDKADVPPVPVAPANRFPTSESTTVILDSRAQRAAGMRLVANTGPAQGSVFDVGEDGATLGRLPDNSICLTDGRLSRHHARVEFRDGGYWLSDLASQNGTLVNDRPLTEAHRLQAGDSIELGTTRLAVMLDSDD